MSKRLKKSGMNVLIQGESESSFRVRFNFFDTITRAMILKEDFYGIYQIR